MVLRRNIARRYTDSVTIMAVVRRRTARRALVTPALAPHAAFLVLVQAQGRQTERGDSSKLSVVHHTSPWTVALDRSKRFRSSPA